MPHTIQIYPAQRLARVVMTGVVTVQDVVGALRDYTADPAWEPGFDRLWDARGIRSLHLGPEDVAKIRSIWYERSAQIGDGRLALVTVREIDTSMAHLFRRLIHNTRVFASIDEALAWLGKALPARDS